MSDIVDRLEGLAANMRGALVSEAETPADADADLAVALVVQKAADQVSMSAPGRWLVVETDRVKAAILALADADALAEVAALKAERDHWKRIAEARKDANDLVDGLTQNEICARQAAEAEVARLNTLEGAAAVVLRYLTNPDWADQHSETFRNMPWQALYDEMRKDRDDFPALVRTHLEAFTDAEFRAALATYQQKREGGE